MPKGNENLSRPLHPMPIEIKQRLKAAGLETAYAMRPPYQRNDYLGWIARAKRPETREKRTKQMIDELKAGDAYMKMTYNGPLK